MKWIIYCPGSKYHWKEVEGEEEYLAWWDAKQLIGHTKFKLLAQSKK